MENSKEAYQYFALEKRSSLDTSAMENQTKKLSSMKPPPNDAFYMVHLLFLLFGIMHLLPISFFVTANDYWMYKFRNTSAETIDPNDRSQLQSYFASGSTIAQSVPTIICLMLSTIFGYKIRARTRVLASLFVLASSFILSTVLIKINTDSWQVLFFALTMTILAIMNGILALFQVSSFVLLSKFPAGYMKTFLIGQGVGGIFSSALQVLSLAIGTSSEASALIYFTLGSILTTATLVLFYVSKNVCYYQYHIDNSVEDTKRDIIKVPELMEVSTRIWSSLVIVTASALAFVPTHPSIASLVVSEYYGQGSSWNGKNCFNDRFSHYYHIDNSVEDTKRDIIKVPELMEVSTRIWSSLVIVTASALAFVPTHPSIASLVVSEYYGQGSSWN
ncbi:equilibrative nucleoside transporter 3-like, partial [Anoplophora glabripennis]|uniref:equilibrative nucleoside transporter 3-like n=1 Tax=Anoplophora glabripennis TaxID=217634 RepID=UPI000C756CC5